MSTWLYHFWLFSFKTAKHWGRGPQTWTADILGFETFPSEKPIVVSSPATSTSQNTPRSISMIDDGFRESTALPSSLCRWSIHVHDVSYESIDTPPGSPPGHIDLDDEESWPAWPASSLANDLTEKLDEGLVRNNFTNVRPSELPIATDQIIRAVKRSPQDIHQEALSFSIMSRNVELTSTLLEKTRKLKYKINGLYPFHLSIAYLDGSKTCCNIMNELLQALPVRQYYVNDLGHTVLDQLMIAILKSHTSCTPSIVDSIFKNQKGFDGAEVDVCGRWDADSPCVRELLAREESSIPFEWKHMFCHTSVQAICHTIGTLFFWGCYGPDINTPSGLFTRRCSSCGLKLQLLPLHALIMVGFHLSRSGCKGENLFGILACLLCLLSYGADPRRKANISLQRLWDDQDSDECTHEEMDPSELIESLVARFASTWCDEIATAWNIIAHVSRQSRAPPPRRGEFSFDASGPTDELDDFVVFSENDSNDDEEKSVDVSSPAQCPCTEYVLNFFAPQGCLATLWAAVKTELLSYRRLTENDAWLSHYFDMKSLEQGLNRGNRVAIPLIEKAMLKPYCSKCGNFSSKYFGCTITEEACAFYFSNMEDWSRTTFITSPDGQEDLWGDLEDV